MAFVMPASNNNHQGSPTANARYLASINAPTTIGSKAAGGLPITNTAGQWNNNAVASTKGIGYEFQASQAGYDVSSETKILLWHNQFNAPNRIQIDSAANAGMEVRLYSGSGSMPTDWREWYVGGNDTYFGECCRGQVPYVIDLNDASHDGSGGTYDNTDVTSYANLTTRFNMAGTNTNWNYASEIYVLDTIKSSANTPTFSGTSDWDDAVTWAQGSDYTDKRGNWIRQIGSVVFIDMPFRIGNNSTETDFDDNGLTVISPVANDSSDPRIRVTTQAFRVYLNLRNNAADTAVFSGTYIWQVRSPWDFDQDDSAIVTFDGPTFSGMGEFTLGSSITGPATFSNVDAVILADTGVDIDGSTFTNPNGDHALEMTAGAMDAANHTYSNYAGKHAILIDTAGTYNWTGFSFDHSGTNDVEVTNSTGEVIINVIGGDVPTVTDSTTGSGTYSINNTVTLTISGMPAGCEWRLYEDSGVTGELGTVELAGIETKIGAGDETYDDNYSSDTNVVLQVIADGFEEFQDYFTLGANPQTRVVSLVAETNT